MGSFSNYAEVAILNHVFKNSALTQPTNIYVALSTADPTEDGSGIAEPVGNNYSRTACNAWTQSSNQVANTSAVTFPTASGSWGTIAYFALYDASTAGNMLAYGAATPSQAIVNGNTPVFAAGALVVTLD